LSEIMIEQDVVFKMFHRYNKLVRRNMAKPLTCEICKSELFTALNEDDELVLRCLGCDNDIVPGLGTISRVEAVVKEHFVDD
jgi:hypothetical protein